MRPVTQPARRPAAGRADGAPWSGAAHRPVDTALPQEVRARVPGLPGPLGRRSSQLLGLEVVVARERKAGVETEKPGSGIGCTGFSVGMSMAGFRFPGMGCEFWGSQLFCQTSSARSPKRGSVGPAVIFVQ